MTSQPTADARSAPKGSHWDPAGLLAPHLGWLRTVIRARLSETGDVEDVLQNVACALSNRSALPPDGRLAPWLYRVALRQILQLRRKEGRQRKLRAAWVARPTPSATVEPDQQLMAVESRLAVRAALDRLGDVDRQVLLLKYTENWSYLDLAQHLGVSRGVIEHRLLKARERLREELRSSHSPDRD